MLRASLLLLATAPMFAQAVYRSNDERIGGISVKMRRFLEEDADEFDMAIYDPCYPCGPSGFTTTPDETVDIFEPGEEEAFTCSYFFAGLVAGMVSEADCPFFTEFFNSVCGCAANPTVSPAPTISSEPTVTPSSSPSPTVAVCYLCGTSNYVDIDYNKFVTLEGTDSFFGDFPCDLLNDPEFVQFFLIEEGDLSCPDVQAVGKDCGCPPLVPTISPAPTTSVSPSSSPSSSPAPSAAPCFFCGVENAWADIDYEKEVNVTALGGMVPCYHLQELAYYSQYDYYGPYDDDATIFGSDGEENGDGGLICEEIQAYGKECGCPPTEPTISPGPTTTVAPSSSPSNSPAPSAAPCFLCGDGNPWADIDYEHFVNVAAFGGPTPCWVLQDYGYFGLDGGYYIPVVEGYDALTCDEVQSYGKECGCPRTEPTSSPAPTVSTPPSASPSSSPAPTAPCSCETLCDGFNEDCGCYCDYICESLGDCCGDVKDYCDFSGYEDFGEAIEFEEVEGNVVNATIDKDGS